MLDLDTPSDDEAFPKETVPNNAKTTVVTKREFIGRDPNVEESEVEQQAGNDFSNIFGNAVKEDRSINKIRVSRKDPYEGVLGNIENPQEFELEIAQRWGGSTYKLEGITNNGKVMSTAQVKIAGEPIFVSQSAEIQWRRQKGLPPNPTSPHVIASSVVAAPATNNGFNIQEFMLLMEEKDNKRRKDEEERKAQERKLEQEYRERMRKLELEAEERKRKDDDERDRRRQKDDELREERRRKDELDRESKQQMFMQQTVAMLQESSKQSIAMLTAKSSNSSNDSLMETIKAVAMIKDVFGDKQEEPQDIPSLLVKHGHEWLNAAGNAVGKAIHEVKAGGTALPPSGPSPNAIAGIPNNPTLEQKTQILVSKLVSKGIDPQVALNGVLDELISNADTIPHAANPMQARQPIPQPMAPQPTQVVRLPEVVPPTHVSAPELTGKRMSFEKKK
jgi:hypothetical protein